MPNALNPTRLFQDKRVALIHDWLVGARGGERVLESLCMLFPHADIFTLAYRPGSVGPVIESHRIHVSPLTEWMGSRFRLGLPWFFQAARTFDLSEYDVIFSSSHCVAHAIRSKPGQRHMAYVHSPMRYLYDQMEHYIPSWVPKSTHRGVRLATLPLRAQDRAAASRIDLILANSNFVSDRIFRVWGRKSHTVYPPVDVPLWSNLSPKVRERHRLLFVGALTPYKRASLALALAQRTGRPLTVVGQGSELARLRRGAAPNVQFVGQVDRASLEHLYATHGALVFPAEEDFGIAPVEAMAFGCPVLGVARGGLSETVVEHGPQATGALAQSAELEALEVALAAVDRGWDRGAFNAKLMHDHACQFSAGAFFRRMKEVVDMHFQDK